MEQEIIKLLENKKACSFGTIVKELNHTYQDVLQNVLVLKQQGKILKPIDYAGRYVLSDKL